MSGADSSGNPTETIDPAVLESIRTNKVCLKGTLFTPLGKHNTSTQSANVQLRKELDLHVQIVHGFSIPGLATRHGDLDIVVIRYDLHLPVSLQRWINPAIYVHGSFST